jgi:5'(3')-deoxyribonucleotidase
MAQFIIGVDMDGCIVDFTNPAIKNANDEFGTDITYEDCTVPYLARLLRDRYPDKVNEVLFPTDADLYKIICPPKFFEKLKPIGNAIEVVKSWMAMGHRIVFITKPLEWKYSAWEKTKWLSKHFGEGTYNLIMVDGLPTKKLVNVDVLVDDDPRILGEDLNCLSICIRQPWNKQFLADNPLFAGAIVDDVSEATGVLEVVATELDLFNKNFAGV